MPRYDTTAYDPPATLAMVALQRFDNIHLVVRDIPLLIDTGADVTLLPRRSVIRLGLLPETGDQQELIAFDGTRSSAEAVALQMFFLNKIFRGRFLLTDANHGILGRDVLAALKLTFDGPQQEWTSVSTPR